MSRQGWETTPDGGFHLGGRGRKIKPPPATPWAIFQARLRSEAPDGPVKISLTELMALARVAFQTHTGRMSPEADRRGWTTLEEALLGWASARRYRLVLDPEAGAATFTAQPRPIPKSRLGPRQSVAAPEGQVGLFDPEVGGDSRA